MSPQTTRSLLLLNSWLHAGIITRQQAIAWLP